MFHRNLAFLVLAAGLAACASTTAEGPGGESMTLVRPADQSLRRGETDKVSVYVRREKLEGPIALAVDNLPNGLEVVEQSPHVEAGYNRAEFTLYARPDADLVTGHAVRITASAGDELKAVEWFNVAVKPK